MTDETRLREKADCTLTRYDAWRGSEVIGDWFVLTRGDRIARCQIRTHPLGWELRLIGAAKDGFELTQVCRTERDVPAMSGTQKW
jgi:hypothetical protein